MFTTVHPVYRDPALQFVALFTGKKQDWVDLPLADKVDSEGNGYTNTESDIRETCNPDAPPFLFLERDGDDR